MTDLSTEDFFGPRPAKTQTSFDLFGPRPIAANMTGQNFDGQFAGEELYASTILNQFGQGFKQAFGTEPVGPDAHYFEKQLDESMKTKGIYKNQKDGEDAVTKDINGSVFRPLAVWLDNYMQGIVVRPLLKAADVALRGPYAAARGLAATETPLSIPGAIASTVMEGFFPEFGPGAAGASTLAKKLNHAHELGITEERYPGMTAHEEALQNIAPRGVESPTERVVAGPVPSSEPLPPPVDIHEAARRVDPETMSRYDDLTAQRQMHLDNVADLKETATKEAQSDLDAFVREKGEDVKNRADQRKLRVLQRALDAAEKEETPAMTTERLAALKAEHEQWDLTPDVRAAYDKAREIFPGEERVREATKPVEPAMRATMKDEQGRSFEIEPNSGGGFDINTPEGVLYAKTFPEAVDQVNSMTKGARVEETIPAGQSIADYVTSRAQLAGRPLEEATLAGQLWQAYYETRAERFGGARGTARDFFNRESPDISLVPTAEAPSVAGKVVQGFFERTKQLIGLTEHQNASTLIHESGHMFLDDLVRDSEHPLAPPQLKADVTATLAWMRSKGQITRNQHEQFARGFERYMMEGTAPTPALARVFEQFKNWLTGIYQSVNKVGKLNDTMRGVYDRLLSVGEVREPIIATDRIASLDDIGTLHQKDAETLFQKGRIPTKEEIFEATTKIRAERDAASAILPTELNNARRRSRQSGAYALAIRRARELAAEEAAGGNPERAGVAGGDEAGTRAESIREASTPETGEVSASGTVDKSVPPADSRGSFEPGGTRVTNADGSPKTENIWSPDDASDAIRGKESTEPRGNLTDKQAIDLADAVGIGLEELPRDRVASAFNATEIKQITQMLIDGETKVHDLMRQVARGATDKVLEFAQAIARLEMFQGMAVQAGQEWGTAGQALKQLRDATGTRSVEQLNTLLKNVTGRDYESLMQLAQLGQNLNSPSSVGQAVRSSRSAMTPAGRGLVYVITNSYLSGTNTHMVYFIGNELRAALLAPLETATSATVGAAREALNLGPKDRVYMREVGAQLSGLAKGTWDGLRPAWEAYKAGAQVPLPGSPIATGNPFQVVSPFSKTTETIIGQPMKIVAAIHQFGLVQFYTQYLYQLATRTAIDEGLNGVALQQRIADLRSRPTPELMAEARNQAQTAMYQRVTPGGSLQRKMVAWTDDYAMAKIIFPFNKIGFEMTRETLLKRTPFGVADSEIRGDLGMSRGGAKFDEATGKILLGTGLFAGGLYLAANGVLSGPGTSDPEENQIQRTLGQHNALTIGPLSVPIGGLGPQGNLLKFAADIWEVGHHAKQQEMFDLAAGYMKALMHATIDEGFLHSAVTLSEAITAPAKNGIRFVTNIAMGLVPYSTGISQINREWIDPYSKEIAPKTQGIIDAIKARIPILSKDVDNQIDVFGQPLPSRGVRLERYTNDETAQWLARLGIGPGKIDRSIWGVRLNERQYNDFEQLAGRYTKEFLDSAVQGGIEQMTKGDQVWQLGRLTQKARKIARQQIAAESMGDVNDIVDKAGQMKAMRFGEEPPKLGFRPE